MQLTDIFQLIGIIVSSLIGLIAILVSVITLRQNNKMIEESTRPYVVAYNDLVNGSGTPIQFLIIKNFGQTAAIIDSILINPKVDVIYSDGMFKHMKNQCIAPGQSYTTAFKLSDCSITLTVEISYHSASKSYNEIFEISQKAISDHVHAKVVANDSTKALKILAGCFQDYLRSNL